jgi:hypothetical protein
LLIGAVTNSAGVDISPDFRSDFRKMGWDVGKFNIPSIFVREKPVPAKKDDELYIIPIPPEGTMEDDRPFLFEVAFYKPGFIECEPVLKTVQDMSNLVSDIVTRLGAFLP